MAEQKDQYVVTAGYATVKTKVGAGMAYVDIPQGQPLPDDVTDEQRDQLIKAGSIARRDRDDQDQGQDGPSDRLGGPAARPVPGLVEPDEIDPDIVPAGSAEQVLAWVGDDLARARVAIHEERAKGLNARQGLIAELEKVAAGEETDPPSVPEHLTEEAARVTPGPGGVVVPSEDPAEGAGKPAEQTEPSGSTKSTRSTSRAKK